MARIAQNEQQSKLREEEESGPRTDTKWENFNRAGLVPLEVWCQAYKPIHPMDPSCHTRMNMDAEQWVKHLDAGHGGGFLLEVGKSEKKWGGWKKLVELGVECVDFRCDVCDKVLPIHTQFILNHMRNHNGKSRRIQRGGKFWLTIGRGRPMPTEEEALDEQE